jgi:hypothetical protein
MSKKEQKASQRSSYRSAFRKQQRSRGGARTPTRPVGWWETTIDLPGGGKMRMKLPDKLQGRKVQLAAARRREEIR